MVENSKNPNKDEVTKASILLAAQKVFQKWGLNKTTMEDIAEEAGKGKSTLYYYYQSKEEIFETVINSEFNQILLNAKKAIQDLASPKEKLKKYVSVSLTEIKNYAIVYPIVREEIKGNKTFIERIRKNFEDSETSFVKEILTSGVQQKEFNFSEEELTIAAKTVVGIIYALNMYLFFDEKDEIELIKKIDITARLIADGL